MTRTSVLSAFEDTSDVPAGLSLDYFDTGHPAVVERNNAHGFGSYDRAGKYVVHMVGQQNENLYAFLQLSMPQAGWLSFWAAATTTDPEKYGIGLGIGSSNSGYGTFSHDLDWTRFDLQVPAGDSVVYFGVGITESDQRAEAWFSRLEAYYGEDPTDPQPLYSQGTGDDPNITQLFSTLEPGGDATLDAHVQPQANTSVIATSTNTWSRNGETLGDYALKVDGGGRVNIDLPSDADCTVYWIWAADAGIDPYDSGEYRNGVSYNSWQRQPNGWTSFADVIPAGTTLDFRQITAGASGYLSYIHATSYTPPAPVSPDGTSAQPDIGYGSDGDGGSTPTAPYVKDDVVRHNGGLYLALRAPTTEPGPGDSDDWAELVPRPSTTSGGSDSSPYAVATRARQDGPSPFEPGERGLWVVLSADGSSVVDLRWENGQ